jgi:hypothetical protein
MLEEVGKYLLFISDFESATLPLTSTNSRLFN